MSDEQMADAPEPQPAPTQAAQTAGSTDPQNPPGDGEDALHYNGTDAITVEGITFAPDAVVIVPTDVAARLIGTNNIRQVAETAESWPHYMAVRARAREGRSG